MPLVTGAGRGIGLEVSRYWRGMTVILGVRSPEEAVRELAEEGADLRARAVDALLGAGRQCL